MSRSSSKEDWVCTDVKCKNINFAKRDKCNRCGKPRKYGYSDSRPELGKHASEKSKGLFSPDDWICKSCGNINWARRSTCNVCNAPKIDIQGERTGYGGGFMERDEVIEYNRRGDSDDDEFDEFGRKKKRFRRSLDEQQGTSQEENEESDSRDIEYDHRTASVKASPEGQDDEEESGDDADLSKYDVWGADDENEENSQDKQISSQVLEPEPSKTRRRSGSRSSSSSGTDSDDSSSDSSSSSARTSHSSRSGSSSSSRSHSPKSRSHPASSHPPKSKSSEKYNGRDRSRFGCARATSNDRDTTYHQIT